MARRDPCVVYPLHAMLESDPMGVGLPAVMPSAADDLDALAKRLDVAADRAAEMARAARGHAESCRSTACRIRRAEAATQSIEARIERGELCGITWTRVPSTPHHLRWHITSVVDGHFIVDAGRGVYGDLHYSLRRSGFPRSRKFIEDGQIDVPATLDRWRAFCAARRDREVSNG